jgi:hypothetical protein
MTSTVHLHPTEGHVSVSGHCCNTLHTAAGAASPLEADAQVIRLFSSVARQLPETDEWDLSGLLVDGQPVSRATVVAWLKAAG